MPTHRVQQIMDAIVAAAVANGTFGQNVFIQRTLSLSEYDGELPALCVMYGDDDPFSELGNDNMAFIDSLAAFELTPYVKADNEKALATALLEMRRQIHITLMADATLGLGFVFGVRYGGAEKPNISQEGGRLAGAQLNRWFVPYRMNITDPS